MRVASTREPCVARVTRDGADLRASRAVRRRHALAVIPLVSVIAIAWQPTRAHADALGVDVDALDPWSAARRAKASQRASRMRRVDAAATAEREARRVEDERARATYAEFAAKKKTRIRLEREGELSAEEIDREVERAGEMARLSVERGVAAEEAELAAFEELMAARRREAAARAADAAVDEAVDAR